MLFMHISWPYILLLITIFILLFSVFYKKIENSYVYFPQTDIQATPDKFHLRYKDVYFYSRDGEKLNAWFLPGDKDAPVILYCHGNACNISHLLEYAGLLVEKNLQVFLFDYRGYGRSTGRPSEKGIYADTQAAYDYLVDEEKIPPGRIVLAGHSVGAAAAIDTAVKNDIGGIIVESAFTSTRDMSKGIFPMSLISFLLPANYNNLEKIAKSDAPKLFIHGQDDEIVPFEMGRRLFDASMGPKYFFPVKAAGHNDTFIAGGEDYFAALADFAYNSTGSLITDRLYQTSFVLPEHSAIGAIY